jgi:hypothetical protein
MQLLTIRGACRLDDVYGEDLDHTDDLLHDARGRIKQSLSKTMTGQK